MRYNDKMMATRAKLEDTMRPRRWIVMPPSQRGTSVTVSHQVSALTEIGNANRWSILCSCSKLELHTGHPILRDDDEPVIARGSYWRWLAWWDGIQVSLALWRWFSCRTKYTLIQSME